MKRFTIILTLLILVINCYAQRTVNIPEKNEKSSMIVLRGNIQVYDQLLLIEKLNHKGFIFFRWVKNDQFKNDFDISQLKDLSNSISRLNGVSLILKLDNGKILSFKADTVTSGVIAGTITSRVIAGKVISIKSPISDSQIKTLIHHKTLSLELKTAVSDLDIPLTGNIRSEIQIGANYVLDTKKEIIEKPDTSNTFFY